MAAGRLYDHVAVLTLAKPTGFFSQAPNAIEIRALRFSFTIERDLKPEPNSCELVVSNLSEASRAEFQLKDLHVTLDVGYDGSPENIFSGDARWVRSLPAGADWETRISLGDGDRAFRQARVSRSFAPGTRASRVVDEILSQYSAGPAPDRGDLGRQFVHGVVLSGWAAQELTRALKPMGLTWSVQDGKVQILSPSDVRHAEALVVDQSTGLVGSPEYGAPTADHGPILSFRSLIYPGLIPGGLVQVASRAIKGTFRLERVRHVGDTRGDEWFTECEASPR